MKVPNLSFGTLPPMPCTRTMTAEVTIKTADGGEPKDFSSVRFACASERPDGVL